MHIVVRSLSFFSLILQCSNIWLTTSSPVFFRNEPKTWSQPGNFKNGQIWPKFGVVVSWVKIWGGFFQFPKNFDFLGLGTKFSPKRGWRLGDFKNGPNSLKFWWTCSFEKCIGTFFYFFFENFDFWHLAWGTRLSLKRG